jgi:hypothetical protein
VARGVRAALVDLVRALGRIRQDGHLAGLHFHEAAADREVLLAPDALDAQFARRQRGEQRRVVRQDAQLALRARRGDHVHVFGEDQALLRDDFTTDRTHHYLSAEC